MRFSIITVFFLISLPLVSFAQVEQEVPYKSETGIGINFNTNGGLIGGLSFKRSVHIRKSMYHLFAFEAVNVKHPKEQRYASSVTGNSFIAYKENYLFSFRPMYGREFLLFRKSEEEGIRVSGLVAAGPSIGLLKPYAIQYDYNGTAGSGSFAGIVNEPYDPTKHTDGGKILGTGGFFTAFNQSKILPGISGKAALSFELGNSTTGVEVGGLFEYYPKTKEPRIIYYGAQNPTFFTSVYVIIFFAIRD